VHRAKPVCLTTNNLIAAINGAGINIICWHLFTYLNCCHYAAAIPYREKVEPFVIFPTGTVKLIDVIAAVLRHKPTPAVVPA
jgi:hypothetical protein